MADPARSSGSVRLGGLPLAAAFPLLLSALLLLHDTLSGGLDGLGESVEQSSHRARTAGQRGKVLVELVPVAALPALSRHGRESIAPLRRRVDVIRRPSRASSQALPPAVMMFLLMTSTCWRSSSSWVRMFSSARFVSGHMPRNWAAS